MSCCVRYLLLFTSLFILCEPHLTAQPSRTLSNDTLATVGSSVITERELIERLELMPWQGKERRDQHDSLKVKAILSMVAERLLAARAAELGLNADPAHRERVDNLERMLVRDELYLREVRGKVKVTAAEISQAVRRFSRTIHTVMFISRTEEDARTVQRKLSSFAPLDSALLVSLSSHVTHSDTLHITMGGIDPAVEDSGFALSATHRISGPVKIGRSGWGVLYYVGSGSNPDAAQLSLPDRQRRVTSLLKTRKERERLDRFTGSVLAPKRAEARQETFELFAENALALMTNDSLRYLRKGGYFFSGILLDSLRRRLSGHLADTFVEIDGGGISVEQILIAFQNEEFFFPSLESEEFRLRLNGAIKRLVEAEFMTREAVRRNLHESENVRRDLGVWDTYWLARVFEQKIRDSVRVSDDEIMDYLIAHARQTAGTWEVNIREVLVDSLVGALRVVERIQSGEPMGEIAREVSRRTVWAVRDGESGFFPIAEHPLLGFHALGVEPGSLVGPIRVSEGYSVFSLIGKRRDPRDTLTFDADTIKQVVRRVLTAEKTQSGVNQVIADLARKVPISIRHPRLSRVEIIPSNMVTRRYLGFGGIMVATPILIPEWDWIKQVPDRKDLLP